MYIKKSDVTSFYVRKNNASDNYCITINTKHYSLDILCATFSFYGSGMSIYSDIDCTKGEEIRIVDIVDDFLNVKIPNG